jgi:hypothetical protein
VIGSHFPWFFKPDTACFDCYQQATVPSTLAKHHSTCRSVIDPGSYVKKVCVWTFKVHMLLHYLRSVFKVPDLDSLLKFTIENMEKGWTPDPEFYSSPFTDMECRYMSAYEEIYSSDYLQSEKFILSMTMFRGSSMIKYLRELVNLFSTLTIY